MPVKNLRRKRFGRLLVLDLSLERADSRHVIWNCLCDCGTTCKVSSNKLNCGDIESCGCLRKETEGKALRKRPFESIYNFFVNVAIRCGHENEITYEDYLLFTKIPNCFYCDSPVVWNEYNRNRKRQPGSCGYNLDRMNSSKGYLKGNIVVCCGRCNRGKSNLFSYEEWLGMTQYLRDKRLYESIARSGGTVASTEGEEGASIPASSVTD